jgi:mannosylglycerate synthase
VSFSGDWITKAEQSGDLDYDLVRHYFPRSSTDAMITWLVTKIGFSLVWPNTYLPHVEQPLGGELMLTRRAVEVLVKDQRVMQQSDWGIDTLYTFVTAQAGLRVSEVYVPEGKVHALYGGLRDLRTMLVECFSALQSLQREQIHPLAGLHRMEPPKAVPTAVREKLGYDIEKTLKLLRDNWTPRQRELLHKHFDSALAKGLENSSEWPCWSFADEEAWVKAYPRFLEHFEKGDDDWEELLFKTWVARVLNHTLKNVVRGYDVALGTLRDLVRDTQHKAALQIKNAKRAADIAEKHPLAAGHSAASINGRANKKAKFGVETEVLCAVAQQ